MKIYTLTHLTRTASDERRVMIQGFDIPWKLLRVLVPASIPALIVAFVFWPWIHAYALVPASGVLGGIYWAVEGRTGDLHIRQYQSWWDKRQEPTGQLVVCGVLVESTPTMARVRSASVSVARSEETFLPDTAGRIVSQPGTASSWF